MRKSTMLAIVLATGAAFGALTPTTPARAANDVTVSVNPGGIAFGYNDGYWDREHHWHNWASDRDRAWYESHEHAHYFNSRHDAGRDLGWRDQDRWWDREHHG